MVHALELIRPMLAAGGVLVDIHPRPEPPPIEVRLGREIYPVGWVREADDYVEYVWADEALATAVARGLYTWEKQGSFAFTTYTDSILELRDHLAETWTDAIIDEAVIGQALDLMQTFQPDKEVILREVVKIARLKPLVTIQV